jgi:hypothetical protein
VRQDIEQDVLNDAALRPLVEAAADQLDRITEGTAMPTTAVWGVRRWRTEPPEVEVTFRDQLGETVGRVSLTDLAEPRYRAHSIRMLWDAVLANRLDRLRRRRLAAEVPA